MRNYEKASGLARHFKCNVSAGAAGAVATEGARVMLCTRKWEARRVSKSRVKAAFRERSIARPARVCAQIQSVERFISRVNSAVRKRDELRKLESVARRIEGFDPLEHGLGDECNKVRSAWPQIGLGTRRRALLSCS